MKSADPNFTEVSDDALLGKALVIVGAPRSGTTFVANIINRHPDLAYIGEPRLIWRYGNDGKSDLLRPEDARPAVKRYVRSSFAAEVRRQGRARLITKSPENSLRMPFVDQILPDCRYVHIIRNGLDSVLSIRQRWLSHGAGVTSLRWRKRLKEMKLRQAPAAAVEVLRRLVPRRFRPFVGRGVWGPRIPGLGGLLHDLELLEVCCLQWRLCVEAARHAGQHLPPDRYLEIRLEELSDDLMRRILDFCGLDDDAAVWSCFREQFDPARPGGRTGHADPAEVERIMQWIGPTMQWLGYT